MLVVKEIKVTEFHGDLYTPVSLYLKIREHYKGSCLLECSEYASRSQCFSYICFDEISSFKVKNFHVEESYAGNSKSYQSEKVLDRLQNFLNSHKIGKPEGYDFIANGIFGYSAYDAVKYFEDIKLENKDNSNIPDLLYKAYRFVVAIDHEREKFFLLENILEGEHERSESVLKTLQDTENNLGKFRLIGEETSNFSEAEHKEMIDKCKSHIFRGDVFQIVPSRRFTQGYEGDDFQLYRALRYINPSPYLFYFDCVDFRIFGSSPEAELVVKNGMAEIHPIAGTCPRSENEAEDDKRVEDLINDPKENSEHVMLVDLARNDLSRHCEKVHVEKYREVQKYSHVIHLVSKVVGKLVSNATSVELLADTFPAGTLSGAPKHMAMRLIDKYEKGTRSFYGGAIGCLGFDGSCNHAIIIRSFLSIDGKLHRQAGGGVVADSVVESEVQEVKNKLGALKKALTMAQSL